jgi:hypothetical protein
MSEQTFLSLDVDIRYPLSLHQVEDLLATRRMAACFSGVFGLRCVRG